MRAKGTARWLETESIDIAGLILRTHRRAYAGPLLAESGACISGGQAAQELFAAATVVLAHEGGTAPRLIYANRAALTLWRRSW
jgi:hypothetical protein